MVMVMPVPSVSFIALVFPAIFPAAVRICLTVLIFYFLTSGISAVLPILVFHTRSGSIPISLAGIFHALPAVSSVRMIDVRLLSILLPLICPNQCLDLAHTHPADLIQGNGRV